MNWLVQRCRGFLLKLQEVFVVIVNEQKEHINLVLYLLNRNDKLHLLYLFISL